MSKLFSPPKARSKMSNLPTNLSKRGYIIYRHHNGNDVEYLNSIYKWTTVFDQALVSEHEPTIHRVANQLDTYKHNICVGRVILHKSGKFESDPYFIGKLIKTCKTQSQAQ